MYNWGACSIGLDLEYGGFGYMERKRWLREDFQVRDLVDKKNWARRTYGTLNKLLQFRWLLGSDSMQG